MDILSLTKEARIYNGEFQHLTGVQTCALPIWYTAPLVKEIVFSPLYILASFVKDKMSIGA